MSALTQTLETLDPEVLKKVLPKLPIEKQIKVKELLDELSKRKAKDKAQNNFLDFVGAMWRGSSTADTTRLWQKLLRK